MSESIKLQGFIDIELVNKKTNVRRRYHNTITNAGKQWMLAKSAGLMLDMTADYCGKMAADSPMDDTYASVGTSSSLVLYRKIWADRCITNVLANLGDEANSLSAESACINLWDNNFNEQSKLVGFANSKLSPTADGKEGVPDFCKGEYIVDPYTVAGRWKYDVGVATGTIDTIAMMPASIVKTNRGDGINVSKCLDQVNAQYANFGAMSTGFLIPGVPGYTANDEIMLNFEKDGCSRWKYSLTTGEYTQVAETDPFFVIPYKDANDAVVIGNYLYVCRVGSLASAAVINIYVYDIADSMNLVKTISLPKGTTSTNSSTAATYANHNARFLQVNGNLYVSAWSCGTLGNALNHSKLWQLTMGGTYYNGYNTAEADFASVGFTAPTGISIRHIGLGSYGSNYVMYVGCNYTNDVNSSSNMDYKYFGYKSMGYVFTDLSNPFGTLVGVICGISPNSILFSAGNNKGMLRIGWDYSGTREPAHNVYTSTEYFKSLVNTENKNISAKDTGVFYTPNGSCANVVSFVKLSTPIVKTDEDIMYVSYGYKVV